METETTTEFVLSTKAKPLAGGEIQMCISKDALEFTKVVETGQS